MLGSVNVGHVSCVGEDCCLNVLSDKDKVCGNESVGAVSDAGNDVIEGRAELNVVWNGQNDLLSQHEAFVVPYLICHEEGSSHFKASILALGKRKSGSIPQTDNTTDCHPKEVLGCWFVEYVIVTSGHLHLRWIWNALHWAELDHLLLLYFVSKNYLVITGSKNSSS